MIGQLAVKWDLQLICLPNLSTEASPGGITTVVSGPLLPTVALLLDASQRRLGLGLKGSGKVGQDARVRTVTARFSPGSGPTEADAAHASSG